jgi:hypothetical protein
MLWRGEFFPIYKKEGRRRAALSAGREAEQFEANQQSVAFVFAA